MGSYRQTTGTLDAHRVLVERAANSAPHAALVGQDAVLSCSLFVELCAVSPPDILDTSIGYFTLWNSYCLSLTFSLDLERSLYEIYSVVLASGDPRE